MALLTIIKFGFFPSQDSWEPVLWVLAAASMIFGNLVALRQTNIVRMLAYSSIAQGGFILVPLAVAGDVPAGQSSFEAVLIYILICGARTPPRSPPTPAWGSRRRGSRSR